MRRRDGFTLIEALIVIVVIAILATIVIPRLLGSGRLARESQLQADLHSFRVGIILFRADCGDWPAQLPDLVASSAPATGGTGLSIIGESYKGPYVEPSNTGLLPPDPMSGAVDWVYDPSTGAVHSASTKTSTEGTAYSAW